MAVILRYSPRLPRYSSMATSLKDFCPKYFLEPLCIFPAGAAEAGAETRARREAPGARPPLMRRR